MTKIVQMVTHISTQNVPLHGPDVAYERIINVPECLVQLDSGDRACNPNTMRDYAPVVAIFGVGRRDVYFAYTQEVEELIGIPIKTILSENTALLKQNVNLHHAAKQLSHTIHEVRHMSFWHRLKFLFTKHV